MGNMHRRKIVGRVRWVSEAESLLRAREVHALHYEWWNGRLPEFSEYVRAYFDGRVDVSNVLSKEALKKCMFEHDFRHYMYYYHIGVIVVFIVFLILTYSALCGDILDTWTVPLPLFYALYLVFSYPRKLADKIAEQAKTISMDYHRLMEYGFLFVKPPTRG